MDRLWAVNASPLIVLGKIGLLSILPRLSSSLIIPSEVAAEVMRGEPDDPARSWVSSGGKSFVKDVSIDTRGFDWNLGAGVSAVV